MSREAKILAGIVLLITGAMVALFVVGGNSSKPSDSATKADASKLVHETSHKTGAGKVTVVEFGDYQCPACGAAYPITKKVMEDYDGKITFVFRNFPLTMHKNAIPAAHGAEAAALQNKFWEMHDRLYEHQNEWSELPDPSPFFDRYAGEIGMDVAKFKQDSASAAIKKIVEDDLADGQAVDIQATPTFYVNGVKAEAFDYDTLKRLIDEALKS